MHLSNFYKKGLVAAISVGLTLPVFAAELEEIVVTAQKREQSLNEVPIAVSVLSSEQIDSTFSTNMESLQAYVPSVSLRTGNTTRNSALTVRGIGTISFSIGAEPSVSTVVDNVVLGRSGQAFGDLYDLERVEVLRGPQGTLFGKNASAGVVNITTKRPTEEFEGYVDLTAYQDNEYRTKIRVAGQLIDGVNASLTLLDSEFDGYIKNVYNNETVNGYDRQGLRAMFDVALSENTQALVIVEDYDADNDCCADLEARESGRNPASEALPANGADLDLDQRRVDHDFETRTLDSTTAMSVQIDHQMGDLTLTSITAQRTWENTEFREGDFTSIAGDSNDPVFGVPFQLHDVGPQEWRQFSQELRLASAGGEVFDWQVGAFYWDIDSERNFTREASCQNNGGQLEAAIANFLVNDLGDTTTDPLDYIADNNITCNANDIVSATGFMSTEFSNWAVFGDASYDLTDDLTAIFGLRYTSDEVSFSHNRFNNDIYGRRGVGVRPRYSDGNNQTDTNFDGSTDDSNVSGKLGLQWRMNDENMFYGTYSQGYKGPAFNVFYNMDSDDIAPILAEESDAYELGYKYTGTSLYLAAALYKTDIENFQANDFDTSDGTTVTSFTNGGDVETEGFEVDMQWQATDALGFSGGVAFSDAVSTTGADLPFAPDLKYSLSTEYAIPAATGGEWAVNASYVYTDDQLSGNIGEDENSNPEVLLPDYAILNASLTYRGADDRYSISLIGKNLTDESYATTYSGDTFRYQIPRDAERYFGANFRFNF